MSRPILCTLMLTAAISAAFYAGAGFVTPRSKAPVPPQQRPLTVTPALDMEKEFTTAPTTEAAESPSFLKWVSAGLLAGAVASVMTASSASALWPFGMDYKPNNKEGYLDWIPGKQSEGNPVVMFQNSPEAKTPFPLRFMKTREAVNVYKGFSVKNWKHLEPCKDSKKYKKIIKDEMFKISKRQGKYPKGSLVWEKLNGELQRTKKREKAYGERWCSRIHGKPMVIPNGEFTRGGVVPGALGFLYTAGWIGWAGRTYIRATRDAEKELKIDVPLALKIMASGFAWPVLAWKDIVDGKFVVPEGKVGAKGGTSFAWWEAPGYS